MFRAGETYDGKQGFNYAAGISAESAGCAGASAWYLLTIQPGDRAKAHMHEGHETAIYVLSGKSVMWYGDRLENTCTVAREGDMVYIPAGVPHLPANVSDQALRRGDRPHRPERAGERGAAARAREAGAALIAAALKPEGSPTPVRTAVHPRLPALHRPLAMRCPACPA